MAQPEENRGIGRRPRILDILGAGDHPEEDARIFAQDYVRAARGTSDRQVEAPAPHPDEVRERREARVRRESRQET